MLISAPALPYDVNPVLRHLETAMLNRQYKGNMEYGMSSDEINQIDIELDILGQIVFDEIGPQLGRHDPSEDFQLIRWLGRYDAIVGVPK